MEKLHFSFGLLFPSSLNTFHYGFQLANSVSSNFKSNFAILFNQAKSIADAYPLYIYIQISFKILPFLLM